MAGPSRQFARDRGCNFFLLIGGLSSQAASSPRTMKSAVKHEPNKAIQNDIIQPAEASSWGENPDSVGQRERVLHTCMMCYVVVVEFKAAN